ncbi:hypothetical protein WBG83_05775 [Paenibacillus sp. y28]
MHAHKSILFYLLNQPFAVSIAVTCAGGKLRVFRHITIQSKRKR